MESEVAKHLDKSLGALAAGFVSSVAGFSRREAEKASFLLKGVFREYVDAAYARCGKVKTLIHRNSPIPLDEAYVRTVFEIQKKEVSEANIFERLSNDDKLIITGSAGCGKSMFMRYCYREMVRSSRIFLPIYVEIRSLRNNTLNEMGLLGCLHEAVSGVSTQFSYDQLEYGLRQGQVILILDGYDELDISLHDKLDAELAAISEIYPKVPIVISSRPNSRFESWEEFTIMSVVPLDKERAKGLIDRIDFDGEVKDIFIREVIEDSYNNNRQFLSNPLLSTMMLLTFETYGEIPESQHEFYRRAFDVLTREHDSLKRGFRRGMFSGATIDQATELFMYFCAFSYFDGVIEFDEEQLLAYISEAIDVMELNDLVIGDQLMRDFCESMSIMIKDGGVYSFIHRSFQEYFAAFYVCKDQFGGLEKVFDIIIERSNQDIVFDLIYSINKNYVESKVILLYLKKMRDEVRQVSPDKSSSKIIKLVASDLSFTKREGYPRLFRVIRRHSYQGRNDVIIQFVAIKFSIHFDLFETALKQEFVEEWIGSDDEKRLSIRKNNDEILFEMGMNEYADRLKSVILAQYDAIERNCRKHREKVSQSIIARSKRNRVR